MVPRRDVIAELRMGVRVDGTVMVGAGAVATRLKRGSAGDTESYNKNIYDFVEAISTR